MGEIADDMVNGAICSYCAVYLHPNETVYLIHTEDKDEGEVTMPESGEEFGVPVYCENCKD